MAHVRPAYRVSAHADQSALVCGASVLSGAKQAKSKPAKKPAALADLVSSSP